MKSQETLSKIMQILNLKEEEVKEVKGAQETLENGTILEAEAFEPGNEVFIVTDDERVALPVGEYELADGRVLVVSEEGVIGEIKAAGAEEEAPAEEVEANEEEEVPAEEDQEEEELNYVTREELAEVVNEIKKMVEEMMQEKEEMAKEKLSKRPRPARKPMKHNPETKPAPQVNLTGKKGGSTIDRVLAKLS